MDSLFRFGDDFPDVAGGYRGAAGALLAPGQGAGVGLHELESDPDTGDWQPTGALLPILGAAACTRGVRLKILLSYEEEIYR